MPELPEVEIAVRRLRAAALGRVLVSVRTLHASTRRVLPDAVTAALAGRRIDAVERRGKHQLLRLDDGALLHAHFRMAGDWHVARSADPLPVHTRAALDLEDGITVALVDPRALGTLVWHAPGVDPTADVALDAIDPAFDAAALGRAVRGRRIAVKPALLDQRVVGGVGNIYAVEALWRGRIDPRVPAGALGPVRRERLVNALRETLHAAIESPGRYQDGDTVDAMMVYGREGRPCVRCGAAVRRIVQAGRSTYFCPGCQRR